MKPIQTLNLFGVSINIDPNTQLIEFPRNIDTVTFLKICNYLSDEGFLKELDKNNQIN